RVPPHAAPPGRRRRRVEPASARAGGTGRPGRRARLGAHPAPSPPDHGPRAMNFRPRRPVCALLLALGGRAGRASVPGSSPVQVRGRSGAGEDGVLPPGPAAGSNPLDLVRDFVFASGSTTERHGAARRFLAPEAAEWDDAAGITVLDGQFDTVPAPGAGGPGSDTTTIRIRGTA